MSVRERPLVSIIVPAHEAGESLGPCLKAIHGSTYPNFEVIVVDDRSQDRSASIAAAFPNQVVSLPNRLGAGAARNRGVSLAQGRILVFVDADVVVQPDTVSALVGRLKGGAQAAVGLYDARARFPNFCSRFKNLWLCYMFLKAPSRIDWFWTGCGAIRRESFEQAGGFDERLTACEDYDLGYKVVAGGGTILLDRSIRVTHRHCRSLGALLMNDFRRSRDNIRVLTLSGWFQDNSFATHRNALSVIVVYAGLLCLSLSWVHPLVWLGWLALLVPFLILSRPFFGFVWKHSSVFFCLRAMALSYLVHVTMGLGALTGLCQSSAQLIEAFRPKSLSVVVRKGGNQVRLHSEETETACGPRIHRRHH